MDSPEQSSPQGTVLVVGMGGRLGARVVRRLHRRARVVGVGTRVARDLPRDVEHVTIDPLRSGARAVFARPGIRAIVFLSVGARGHERREEQHSHRLLAFQRVIEYAELYNIPKVILLSSANTYGPRPENAQFLSEQAPLLAAGANSEMHTMVELDMTAQACFWRRPEIELVILRPVNILGTVRNAPSNYLRLPVVTTLLGFDPMVQTVHQDDVAAAIELALVPGVRGIYNIAGPPPVPLSKGLAILGRRTVSLPHSLARGGLSGLFRVGMSRFFAPELDFLRYVCMVDDSAARKELGYRSHFSLSETLHAVDDDRWVE